MVFVSPPSLPYPVQIGQTSAVDALDPSQSGRESRGQRGLQGRREPAASTLSLQGPWGQAVGPGAAACSAQLPPRRVRVKQDPGLGRAEEKGGAPPLGYQEGFPRGVQSPGSPGGDLGCRS